MTAPRPLGSLLFALGLCVITPPFSLLALLIFWAPARVRYHAMGQWCRLVVGMCRWLCGIRHEVVGLENLPEPPYVICSKHQSAWETAAFYGVFPHRISFVVKKELLWIPFFGWGLWICMSPIPIDRGERLKALKSVLAAGRKRLAGGVPVCVFPEGTRVAPGGRRDFSPAAGMLATDSTVPVVPVAHNSGRCWPRGLAGLLKRSGTVTVSVGEPIDASSLRPREVTAKAKEWVDAETERLGG